VMNLVGLLVTPAIVEFSLNGQSTKTAIVCAISTLIIIAALVRNRRHHAVGIEY
jgi:K(+)-stimulated pyrophosphate-energized sodium pump